MYLKNTLLIINGSCAHQMDSFVYSSFKTWSGYLFTREEITSVYRLPADVRQFAEWMNTMGIEFELPPPHIRELIVRFALTHANAMYQAASDSMTLKLLLGIEDGQKIIDQLDAGVTESRGILGVILSSRMTMRASVEHVQHFLKILYAIENTDRWRDIVAYLTTDVFKWLSYSPMDSMALDKLHIAMNVDPRVLTMINNVYKLRLGTLFDVLNAMDRVHLLKARVYTLKDIPIRVKIDHILAFFSMDIPEFHESQLFGYDEFDPLRNSLFLYRTLHVPPGVLPMSVDFSRVRSLHYAMPSPLLCQHIVRTSRNLQVLKLSDVRTFEVLEYIPTEVTSLTLHSLTAPPLGDFTLPPNITTLKLQRTMGGLLPRLPRLPLLTRLSVNLVSMQNNGISEFTFPEGLSRLSVAANTVPTLPRGIAKIQLSVIRVRLPRDLEQIAFVHDLWVIGRLSVMDDVDLPLLTSLSIVQPIRGDSLITARSLSKLDCVWHHINHISAPALKDLNMLTEEGIDASDYLSEWPLEKLTLRGLDTLSRPLNYPTLKYFRWKNLISPPISWFKRFRLDWSTWNIPQIETLILQSKNTPPIRVYMGSLPTLRLISIERIHCTINAALPNLREVICTQESTLDLEGDFTAHSVQTYSIHNSRVEVLGRKNEVALAVSVRDAFAVDWAHTRRPHWLPEHIPLQDPTD